MKNGCLELIVVVSGMVVFFVGVSIYQAGYPYNCKQARDAYRESQNHLDTAIRNSWYNQIPDAVDTVKKAEYKAIELCSKEK